MTGRTSHCRYCGAKLSVAETGRTPLFCNDLHRKRYTMATADRITALLADVDTACAARELRELQCDLLGALQSTQRLSRRLEINGDVVTRARVAAVAAELERTLARHFGDLEAKP